MLRSHCDNAVGLIIFAVVFVLGHAGAAQAEAPTIDHFAINNGAATTTSRTVTLNNTCSGNPNKWLANDVDDTSGIPWQEPYSTAPTYVLPAGPGLKIVYFMVQDTEATGNSAWAVDTIELLAAEGEGADAWYNTFDYASAGVAGYWPLDKNAMDYSWNQNHGVRMNTAPLAASVGAFNGSVALELDPAPEPHAMTDGHILLPGSSGWDFRQSFSVALWVKADPALDGLRDTRTFMTKRNNWHFAYDPVHDNEIRFRYNYGQPQVLTGVPFPSGNAFHHLAFSYDAAVPAVTVYLDGESIAYDEGSALFYNSDYDLQIGATYAGPDNAGDGLGGHVDEVVLFRRAIASDEVRALSNDANGNNIADFWEGCGNAWITSPVTGNKYRLTCPGTWADAEAEAVAAGGHLAKIETEAENAWIVDTFSEAVDDDYIWIGLNDYGQEGVWVWADGAPLGPYQPWNTDEPNGGDAENGGIVFTNLSVHAYRWGDLSNNTAYVPGVIERPACEGSCFDGDGCSYACIFDCEWDAFVDATGIASESWAQGLLQRYLDAVADALCDANHRLHEPVIDAYEANLSALEGHGLCQEYPDVQASVQACRHALAALLLVSNGVQDYLADGLGLECDYVLHTGSR